MAIDSDKMVTFSDLGELVAFEGFDVKNPFDDSVKKACTKAEVDAAIEVEKIAEYVSWPSNKLVPRRLLNPRPYYWDGMFISCETTDIGDDPPTAPVIYNTSATPNSLTISYSISSDDNGIDHYQAYIRNPQTGTVNSYNAGLSLFYTFNGLNANTQYEMWVVAVDTIGQNSPDSNHVNAYTTSASTGVNTMGILTYVGANTGSVDLVWADPEEVKSGQTVSTFRFEYRVYGSGSSWTLHGSSVSGSLRETTLTGLSSNTNYEMRARFQTNTGEWSSYSNIIIFATTAPTVLSCGTTDIEGSHSNVSKQYTINMSGSTGSFMFEVQPYSVPDRFVILSGGNVLYDSKYIGSSSDYFVTELDRLGVPASDRRLGQTDLIFPETEIINEGQTLYRYGRRGYISANQITGGQVTLIVFAPVNVTTWRAKIQCPS
jgi:hypothetical protein